MLRTYCAASCCDPEAVLPPFETIATLELSYAKKEKEKRGGEQLKTVTADSHLFSKTR
jgi:hypothetical protein